MYSGYESFDRYMYYTVLAIVIMLYIDNCVINHLPFCSVLSHSVMRFGEQKFLILMKLSLLIFSFMISTT